MSTDDKSRPEQRDTPRIPVGVVRVEFEGSCTSGRIYDISASGLRIVDCDTPPPVGCSARVTFILAVDQPGFEIEGTVVRHTDDKGFALRFDAVGSRLREILGHLSDRAQDLPDLDV